MTRFLRLFLRNCKGNAAAEMGLMLPLLTLLLFGGIEMSNFFWTEHQVIKSVRNGTRFAARQDTSNFACGANSLGTADAAVRNLIRTGTTDGSGSPVVRDWTDGASTITIEVECDTGSTYSNAGIYADMSGTGSPSLSSATRVKIDVEVPFPSLFGSFGFFDGIDLYATGQSPVTGF